jgi:hypothetical protein
MHPDPDDDLAALRAALDVEPGPGFAAGVRQRIDREHTGAWGSFGFGIVAAAALAGAILWTPWSQRDVPPSTPRVAAPDAALVTPAPASARTELLPSGTGQRTPVGAAAPRPARTVRAIDSERSATRVLIAHDEARAFARLLAAVHAGQVALPEDDDPVKQALVRATEGPQPTPIVRIVVPLEIEPYPELEN